MKTLAFEAIGSTPGIILDKDSGKFQITGQSFPEDAFEFFNPIFQWFDQYVENPCHSTVIDFQLSYFNTVSAKNFLHIMTLLEQIPATGHTVKVRWFYNDGDDEMYEAGEEFGDIVDIDFEMVPVQSDEVSETDEFFDDMLDDLI